MFRSFAYTCMTFRPVRPRQDFRDRNDQGASHRWVEMQLRDLGCITRIMASLTRIMYISYKSSAHTTAQAGEVGATCWCCGFVEGGKGFGEVDARA